MLCIELQSANPFFNLAVDEYLLRETTGEIVVLGINAPSVVIGKHQVAHREADTEVVTGNNIPVIRRISGGGAVYHDHGNLNFSFILKSSAGKQVDFRKYTLPVMEFLESEGIKVDFEGKSDLKIDGFKISGNAEHVFRERVLHHGTLLFDTRLDVLSNSLRKDTSRYSTRAVGSNPSPVMNLREKLSGIKNAGQLRDRLFAYLLKKPGNSRGTLSTGQVASIERIAAAKYRTWEWNYAYGPEYQFSNSFEIGNGKCTCLILVKDGIIRRCEVEGPAVMKKAGANLVGCRHMPEDLRKVLIKENVLNSASDIYKFF